MLAALDVPYLAAHALEFQTLEQWGASERGLHPVENTMMVAIPELDGATSPTVFGGRSDAVRQALHRLSPALHVSRRRERAQHACLHRSRGDAGRARCEAGRACAARPARTASWRSCCSTSRPTPAPPARPRISSVYESLWNTLNAPFARRLRREVPASVDALRTAILGGNSQSTSERRPTSPRAFQPTTTFVANAGLREIEAQWGPAPGKIQADGRSIFVLGEQFGNVFVGVQPTFGYEGDPMRLLFEHGLCPDARLLGILSMDARRFRRACVPSFRHARRARVHAGQAGRTVGQFVARQADRRRAELYLYAANNPSEGTIAKRRSAATLISYLTPPVAQGRPLPRPRRYQELARPLPRVCRRRRTTSARASRCFCRRRRRRWIWRPPEPAWTGDSEARVADLGRRPSRTRTDPHSARTARCWHAAFSAGARRHAARGSGRLARRRAGTRVDRGLSRVAASLEHGLALSGLPPTDDSRRCIRRAAEDRRAPGGRPRNRRRARRARRAFREAGPGRRPAPHAADPADRPQCARFRSVPHPERVCRR